MQIDDDQNPWLDAIADYERSKIFKVVDAMAVDEIPVEETSDPKEKLKAEKAAKVFESGQHIQFQYFLNPVQNPPLYQREQRENNDVQMEPATPTEKPSTQISILKLLGGVLLICTTLIAFSFIFHFYSDVFFKIQHRSSQVNMKIAACAKSYLINSCASITGSIPHMVSICNEWADCMQQDPDHVDRLSVLGEVFSSLLNAFIDPLSWKVVSVATVWIFSSIYIFFQLSLGTGLKR